MKNFVALFFLLLLFSCSPKNKEWQEAELTGSTLCTTPGTQITTNHQGEHSLTDCAVFIDNDTLYIRLFAPLPAYWLGAEITLVDGMFNADAEGIPFEQNATTYRIKKQQLHLSKQRYAVGDTLQGYVDITFKEEDKTRSLANEYYLKGCIYKIVRAKEYQPFEDDRAIMSYSLDFAINELGQPLNDYFFNTIGLPEFRIELLNSFPPSDSIYIRELTWNTSNNAQISDEGIYRLTVWYAQKDSIWMPVLFCRWNTNMQF